MTKINYKLLTSSTSVIEGVPGDYTLKTVSHTIDTRIKKTVNRAQTFPTITDLADELAIEIANTLLHFHQEGHVFNITIKDYQKNPEQ